MEEGIFVLVAFVAGFLVAQVWKLIAGLITGYRTGEMKDFGTVIRYFARSGGMPSGHTASFTAATVYIGLLCGFNTGLFALALCVWIIVVYDSLHVRYAVGEQGRALNELLKKADRPEVTLVEGHTVPQVVVGALLGIALAMGIFALTGGFTSI